MQPTKIEHVGKYLLQLEVSYGDDKETKTFSVVVEACISVTEDSIATE